jgi:hypothetical protein
MQRGVLFVLFSAGFLHSAVKIGKATAVTKRIANDKELFNPSPILLAFIYPFHTTKKGGS